MDHLLRNNILSTAEASKKKTLSTEILMDTAKRQISGIYSDFEIQKRLLHLLEKLEEEGCIRLPSRKGKEWNRITGLPNQVRVIRSEEDADKQNRKEEIENLRNRTAWEPVRMLAFAPGLHTKAELERAKAVNEYLKNRKADEMQIPHRERALQIFGNEKALDPYVKTGLFSGRIILENLDCFYCTEPLPFEPLSGDVRETKGKPLLIIENSNTYWSCCQANRSLHFFAAVVYGKGFNVLNTQQVIESLQAIEKQTESDGLQYFGDIDPAGLSIPQKINQKRKEMGLPLFEPAISLYRALLEKGLTTDYERFQQNLHDPEWAEKWLGSDIAEEYLKHSDIRRWPQEGLTAQDIRAALEKTTV